MAELGSGFFGLDFDSLTDGSDKAVLPDVSYGGPDQQPETAAGNGFGNWLTGALDKAVNYALAKDAASWNPYPTAQQQAAPVAVQPRPYQTAGSGGIQISNQLLLMVGAGLLIFMVAKKA